MHRQASEAQSTLAQAHGTSSKMRSYFYPWKRLTTERPNTIQLARCKMSSQAFSHRGKDLALQRDFWLKPRKPAYPPGLETQRLATGFSSVITQLHNALLRCESYLPQGMPEAHAPSR